MAAYAAQCTSAAIPNGMPHYADEAVRELEPQIKGPSRVGSVPAKLGKAVNLVVDIRKRSVPPNVNPTFSTGLKGGRGRVNRGGRGGHPHKYQPKGKLFASKSPLPAETKRTKEDPGLVGVCTSIRGELRVPPAKRRRRMRHVRVVSMLI